MEVHSSQPSSSGWTEHLSDAISTASSHRTTSDNDGGPPSPCSRKEGGGGGHSAGAYLLLYGNWSFHYRALSVKHFNRYH